MICVECHYHKREPADTGGDYIRCTHPEVVADDPVIGRRLIFCEPARSIGGRCGPSAKHFIQHEMWFVKMWHRVFGYPYP